jgi:uncharacterized membrane protein YjgN (DUF898 family)
MDVTTEPAEGLRSQQLAFRGNIPAFLGVVIINLLLTIVTLGIYRFWAKTRVRHYLWANTTFDGEPLEYRGRGLELLVGAVLAFLIFLLPAVAFSLGEAALQASRHFVIAAVLQLILIGGIYYLVGVGFYRAERYLISRTSWRGIRGGMLRGGWGYGGLFILMALFQVITLGFGRPYAQVRLWNARMNDVMFGSAKAEASAAWRPLFARYTLSFVASLIILGVAAAIVASDFIPLIQNLKPGVPQDPHIIGPIILRLYGVFILAGIATALIMLSYHAAYYREIFGKTRLEAMGFAFAATTGAWLRYYVVNALIVILTLGLGFMIMPLRAWAFYMRNIRTVGSLDTENLMQTQLASPSQGEGIADALGISILPF